MATRDVPRDQWKDFLDGFSRRHRAWLATVDQFGGAIGHGGSTEAPLGSVTATREGRDVAAIEIAFAGDGHIPLRVEHPRIIRVRQTGDGAETGLEIVDDEGMSTRVGFRATARPEMLDGLAPGEM
ncbi:MAG TPA: DUF5335 family protein [Vicinamibacterales bacterium]|jgi:hypothetical protein